MIPSRYCEACLRPLERRKQASGLERPAKFAKRRFCRHACALRGSRRISSEVAAVVIAADRVTDLDYSDWTVAKDRYSVATLNPAIAALRAAVLALRAARETELQR